MAKTLPWNWETLKSLVQLSAQSAQDFKPGTRRDWRQVRAKLRSRFASVPAIQAWSKDSHESIPWYLEQTAARIPDKIALVFEGRQWTWREFNEEANRIAHACDGLGWQKGDVVCLHMENRPEYLFTYYGLAKRGVIPSLINTNLQEGPLRHALQASNAKGLIIGSECLDRLATLGDDVPIAPEHSYLAPEGDTHELPGSDWHYFSDVVDRAQIHNPPTAETVKLRDTLCYIFTSGTTGNPKPAIINHDRYYRAAHGWGGLALALTEDDVMYCVLPLYHGNGNLIAASIPIVFGTRIVLRRKFSASRFWDECREHGVTCFVYIGELCRYLMNQPPRADDADNPVVRAIGNGLRMDIWEDFLKRFRLRRVVEFYASSEGNAASTNFLGPAGSVGQWNPDTMKMARWDMEHEDLVRGADGFAIECAVDEPGCLLGEITQDSEFTGYTSKEATERKILRNVFREGDAYYNTGDMLKVDATGYLYFIDRLGDTFRWKGENVSTQEIGEQLTMLPWVDEATVYGVQIPGADGRAGMAALVLQDSTGFDPAAFYAHVAENLPPYAQPLFLRVRSSLDVTGTFKHQKVALRDAGFNPGEIDEALYFRDPAAKNYVPLTAELHADIVGGQRQL